MKNKVKHVYRDYVIELILNSKDGYWYWIIGDGAGLGRCDTRLQAMTEAESWVDEFIKVHEGDIDV